MIRNRVEAPQEKNSYFVDFIYDLSLWIINKLLYFFHCVTD